MTVTSFGALHNNTINYDKKTSLSGERMKTYF